MCVWSSPGCKDTSFRIQIHALKKPGTTWTSSELYLGLPSKRKREASSGCGEQTTHCCSSAIEITLGTCSRRRPSKGTAETSFSISSKNIASQCLWQPSRVVYKEEDSDPKRETTSSQELNQRKTIEDDTRVTGNTHYVFARNLF